MIELNEIQCQILQQGKPVRVTVAEIGTDCVVVRADVYERQQTNFDNDEPDMHAVAALIERNMREDDANDPLLESYQDCNNDETR